MSARGLALLAEARGDPDRAFDVLADAFVRCHRLADPYIWLDAYILDAQATLGLRHGHADTAAWVEQMRSLASRTDMREMTVRSLVHAAAAGDAVAGAAATLLMADIDDPHLAGRVAQALPAGGAWGPFPGDDPRIVRRLLARIGVSDIVVVKPERCCIPRRLRSGPFISRRAAPRG